METVVVTGAGGFIGGNLAKALLDSGVKVYGMDISSDRMQNLCKYENFIPVEATFEQYGNVPSMIRDEKVDVFYHLAWMGYGKDTNDFQVQIKNVEATHLAATIAGKMKAARFVFACSSHEYQKNFLGNTESGKVGYCSIYGASKTASKAYAKVVAHSYNMAFNGAIFTNVFGVGDTSNRSANTFIRKLINGENLQLIKGEDLYDWTYIDDVVGGLIAIGERGIDGKEYYVGSSTLRPFREIVIELRDIISPQSELEFGVYPDTAFIDYSNIHLHDLYNDTGYFPHCNFKESVLKTVEWIKDLDSRKGEN